MRQVKNKNLAELLMQLRFAPAKQRRKQVGSAVRLLKLIDRKKQYPFEFVCFHITGFRPTGPDAEQIINGNELAEDLQVFIAKLSGQVAEDVSEQGQRVYNIDELAAAMGVSTKTIGRWRKRGLVAQKFVFGDGKKRLGFLQSTIDSFLRDNKELAARARGFTRLSKKQKQQIVKRARSLASNGKLSRYEIIERIAEQLSRSHEMVRYTLINYEKDHPKSRVFKRPAGVVTPAQSAELYKLYQNGCSVNELTRRYNRTKSSIYRIINRRRARQLLARKIEFIKSDEFLTKDAKEQILAEPVSYKALSAGKSGGPLELAGGSLAGYLQAVKSSVVLNRQQEVALFRRYNFLKYLAHVTMAGLDANRPSSKRMGQIERYLAEAEQLKNIIIEANLRVVVGIAGKHAAGRAGLLDLISEGNLSLMRAVEKFDYTRGFRFVTYASWAIAKDFARKVPAKTSRPEKTATESLVHVQRDLRVAEAADFAAIERARKSLVQVIRDDLDEREQYIILNHFGLIGSLVKKKKKTLAQIGQDLRVSKERVRQIELVALQKLRHSLSPEQFDLLTG